MTISYSGEFLRLLFKWKGSLYKAVLAELLIFYLAYYIVMIMTIFLLDEEGKKEMVKLATTFEVNFIYGIRKQYLNFQGIRCG